MAELDVPGVWLRGCAGAFLLSGFLFLGYAGARRLVPRAPWEVRLLGVAVLSAWASTAAFHALLVPHAFRLGPALVLVAITCAVVAIGGPYGLRDWRRDLARDGRRFLRTARATVPGRPVAVLLVAFVVAVGWRSLLVVPWSWDTVMYHAVKAALWVKEGGPIDLVAPGGWAFSKDYFGGGEVFWAWAMLPFGGDLVVGVVDWVTWLGLGLGVWTLAGSLGIPGRVRLVGLLYVLTLPSIGRAVGSGYVDTALHAFLFAAVAFAIRYRTRGDGNALVLFGAAAGLAAGVKITALSSVAGLVLVLVILEIRAPALGRRVWRPAALGAAAAAVSVAPWLWSNLRTTGTWLGAVPVTLGPFRLGRMIPEMAWFLDRPDITPYALGAELRALLQIFHWVGTPVPHLSVLSLPLVVAGAIAFPALWRKYRQPVALVGITALAAVANVYQPSFAVPRLGLPWASGRFLLPVVVVALLFLLGSLRGRPRLAVATLAYLLGGAAIHAFLLADGWSVRMATIVAVLTAATVALPVVRDRLLPRVGAPIRAALVGSLVLLAGLPLLDGWKRIHRYEILASNVVLHDVNDYWLEAAEQVDRPPGRLRVAFTAGPTHFQDQMVIYHFFGTRLQNDLLYVPSSVDGSVIPHDGPDPHLGRRSYARWNERLARTAITHVMSFYPRSVELGWMEARPDRFRSLAGDGETWGLFELTGVDPGL